MDWNSNSGWEFDSIHRHLCVVILQMSIIKKKKTKKKTVLWDVDFVDFGKMNDTQYMSGGW